jgi:phospholipid-binding lipoprotein MlaA
MISIAKTSARSAHRPGVRLIAMAALAVVAAAGRAGAAQAPAQAPRQAGAADAFAIEDPFEKTNRGFFENHQKIDRAFIRPVALGYEHVVPRPIRDGMHNLITELGEPAVFANYMVQLRLARAGRTVARFLANATIGLGGLMDPATKMGLPHHANGFGDTLGRYGMKPGPYLFLPLVGPTDFRDLLGLGVDFAVDPLGWGHYDGDAYVRGGLWTIGGLDQRARAEPDLRAIEAQGTDFYASMRSYYLQNREAQIRGGAPIKIEELPSFDEEPTPAPPSAPATPPAAPPSASSSAAPTSAVVFAAPSAHPHASGDVEAFLAPQARRPAPAAGLPIEL